MLSSCEKLITRPVDRRPLKVASGSIHGWLRSLKGSSLSETGGLECPLFTSPDPRSKYWRWSLSNSRNASFFRLTMNRSSGIIVFLLACLANNSRSSPTSANCRYTSSTKAAVNRGVAVISVPESLDNLSVSCSTILDTLYQMLAFKCCVEPAFNGLDLSGFTTLTDIGLGELWSTVTFVAGTVTVDELFFRNVAGPMASQSSSSVKLSRSLRSGSCRFSVEETVLIVTLLTWSCIMMGPLEGEILVRKNDCRVTLEELENETLGLLFGSNPSGIDAESRLLFSSNTASIDWLLNDERGFLGFAIPAKEGRRFVDENEPFRNACFVF
ncbi:hypothetical protein OGAPHI_003499 [Ogataea philodendri]|uniref:Uncharacterized protein n=1 Tax=Ogataea philodendri TaxID=1378263 RepID=A0A9P8P637_9ASCO|nr:uncharacterized protein OGAPHI_003499 [Ogataea philodendri]KAH3666503.1 hypothetical protein OGAPHI_003499 [Ogataea philodendri]